MGWHTESQGWTSGPWSLELRGDEFADIAFGGRTLLRSVRAVVRDRDWDTAPLVVDAVRASDLGLTLHVRSVGLGSSFSGIVRAEVRPGHLRIVLDVESADAFATNRTGLVILHPPQLAGTPAEVRHPDGTAERTAFPAAISPHQPIVDVAGLTWAVGGATVTVDVEGDVFEMEDQRNWTDASYKTYSRPLSLPFPYDIAAGERVRQTVSIRVDGDPGFPAATGPATIDLRPGGAFPATLLGAASAPDPAPPGASPGAGVLVELDLATPTWPAALRRAASGGAALDVRLILAPGDTTSVADAVAALAGLDVLRVAAFHQVTDARHVSDAEAVTAVREALAAAGSTIPVIGGSRSHFTELNRERHRLPGDLDGIAVTVTPLFHATGTEQLVESVAMQRLVALQTVEYAADLPVHVGPVCLRPRFNDVATGTQPAPTRDDLAEGYGAEFTGSADPRQSAPELAAWTVASAAALAVPGVASIAWYEQWGPRGIRTAAGDPLPVAAAIDALAALGERADGELLWGDSPDGLLWALGVRRGDAVQVLAANLDRVTRILTVTAGGSEARWEIAPGGFVRGTTTAAPPPPTAPMEENP